MSGIADLNASLELDSDPWITAMNAAADAASKFLDVVTSASHAIGGALTNAVEGAFSYAVSHLKEAFETLLGPMREAFDTTKALKAAEDYENTAGKVQAAFGTMAGAAQAYADKYAAALGHGRLAAEQMIGEAGLLFTEMGFGNAQTEQLSESVMGLASNLAAMTGKSDIEAMHALDSALQGNTRSLRQYGVTLTQAQILQELHREGFQGTAQQATQAQKAIAAYNVIVAQSAVFQGQANEESQTYNGIVRQLAGTVEDASLAFGQTLQTAVVDAINAMGGVGAIKPLVIELAQYVAESASQWIRWAGEIGKWGMAAINAVGGPKAALLELKGYVLEGISVFASWAQGMTPWAASVVNALMNVGNVPQIIKDKFLIAWDNIKVATLILVQEINEDIFNLISPLGDALKWLGIDTPGLDAMGKSIVTREGEIASIQQDIGGLQKEIGDLQPTLVTGAAAFDLLGSASTGAASASEQAFKEAAAAAAAHAEAVLRTTHDLETGLAGSAAPIANSFDQMGESSGKMARTTRTAMGDAAASVGAYGDAMGGFVDEYANAIAEINRITYHSGPSTPAGISYQGPSGGVNTGATIERQNQMGSAAFRQAYGYNITPGAGGGQAGANVSVQMNLPGVSNITPAVVEGQIMPLISQAMRRGAKL